MKYLYDLNVDNFLTATQKVLTIKGKIKFNFIKTKNIWYQRTPENDKTSHRMGKDTCNTFIQQKACVQNV